MIEYLNVEKEALFEEIVDRALKEGVAEREAFEEFVDFILQEKLQVGELAVSDPLPGLKDHLKKRWPEYQERINVA